MATPEENSSRLEATGLILFAHGSTVEDANRGVHELAARVEAAGPFRYVRAAFLDCAEPTLTAAVEAAAQAGLARLVIVPYFLTTGMHLSRDLPELLAALRPKHPDLTIEVGQPLEGHPEMPSLILERARQALAKTLAVLLLLAGWSLLAAPARAAQQRNVILITIDTLRADHLHCYGDAQIQTPNIDALARAGARFTQAYSPVPITLPAHTVIMTGAYPMATGMHDFSGNRLPAGFPTLASVLRAQGYSTAAFIGSAVLDGRFGLNQGFETYFDHFDFSRLNETNLDLMDRRGDQVMDNALAWLELNPPQPFLLWVHLYDPHYPYTPPEPYASRYRAHPYDGEIAFADAQVGRLFAFLRERGWYDSSVIALMADHGEGLGEHGEKTHGFFIYNSTLHVPLIIKAPGDAPRVVTDEVSLADVMPTLLQALGVAAPPSVQGRSLLSLLKGQPSGRPSVLYSESYLPLLHFRWSQLRGYQSRGKKYIDAPRREFYDLHTDPHETKNLYATRQALARGLGEELDAALRRFTPTAGNAQAAKELTDPALLDRLRSLGYVAVSAGTFSDASGKPLPDPKDRIQVYELVDDAMTDGQHARYDESLAKLRRAAQTEPDSIPIRYLMALDYYRKKDYPNAIAEFERTLKIDPKFALATYYLGLTQLELQNFDAAAASFQRALELDPTNFSAAYNLGAVHLRQERVNEALSEFQKAIEINPDYVPALVALGEIYLFLNRPGDAAKTLEHAVAVAPGLAKAHLDLARAYQALGRGADAQRELERARTR